MNRGMELSVLARDVQARALAELFREGTMQVYSGERPEARGAPVTAERLLVRWPLTKSAIAEVTEGVIKLSPLERVEAVGMGAPSFFRCFTKEGQLIMESDVCREEGQEGLLIPDQMIYPGMLLRVEEFQHAI